MSNYIYTNDGLVNVDELMHYGVPGMKWGERRALKRAARYERRAAKKFAKVGYNQGYGDYRKDAAVETRKKHESMAGTLDRKAKQLDKKGSIMTADLTRRAAEAVRKRGMNASASDDAYAANYQKRAEKLLAKANKYAEKKHVDIGKLKVNSIIKEARKKGYEAESSWDEANKESRLQETLGDRNYDIYNKIRGRS